MKSIHVSGCPDLCCSFSNLEKDSAFGRTAFGRILNIIYSKHPVVRSLDACFAGAYLCGVTKKHTFFPQVVEIVMKRMILLYLPKQ